MKNNPLQKLQLLKDVLEEAIDRGVGSVQRIHETIADIPFDALERSGVLPAEAGELREKQRQLIGMVYDTIRHVTRGVGEFVSDQIENLEEGAGVAELLGAETKPAPPPAPATAYKRAAKVATRTQPAVKRVAEKAQKSAKKAAKKVARNLASGTKAKPRGSRKS